MTDQEAFDKMVTHLRTQGKRAARGNGICMLRTPDGAMCPVGCLIPESKYTKEMELETLTVLHEEVSPLGDLDFDLLYEMCYLHDKYGVDEWEQRFATVAKLFGLKLKEKL